MYALDSLCSDERPATRVSIPMVSPARPACRLCFGVFDIGPLRRSEEAARRRSTSGREVFDKNEGWRVCQNPHSRPKAVASVGFPRKFSGCLHRIELALHDISAALRIFEPGKTGVGSSRHVFLGMASY